MREERREKREERREKREERREKREERREKREERQGETIVNTKYLVYYTIINCLTKLKYDDRNVTYFRTGHKMN